MKRVVAGEIQVSQSYNVKVIMVMPTELYHQMSVVHTEGDKKVAWRELQTT